MLYSSMLPSYSIIDVVAASTAPFTCAESRVGPHRTFLMATPMMMSFLPHLASPDQPTLWIPSWCSRTLTWRVLFNIIHITSRQNIQLPCNPLTYLLLAHAPSNSTHDSVH